MRHHKVSLRLILSNMMQMALQLFNSISHRIQESHEMEL